MIFYARVMMEKTLNDNDAQTLPHKIPLQKLESNKPDHQKMETRVIKVRMLIIHEYIRVEGY